MPEHRIRKKALKRTLGWLLAALALAVAALTVWIVVVPMVTADAVTSYASFAVATGDIHTYKSFSATLSVKKSETFSATEAATVRELYVSSGDAVQEGDPLVLLSTGDLFTASFDGVVNEIRVKVGDWLWPNFTVVQVSDLTHLKVSMNVDEYDVEGLSLGQACTVSVISLGTDFETVIAHVNRVSQSQGTVAYYSVSCDLTVPENVLPGMQATVTLPADSVSGVTTVPAAALAFDEDRNAYVLLKDASGAYQRQTVQTGLSDGMTVEITDGLTAGQTVYAVSGTESVKASLTLADIYAFLFGKKTVVNDMSERAGGQGGFPGTAPDGTSPSGTMPDGTSGATTGEQTAGGDAATQGGTAATEGTEAGAAGTDAATGTTGSIDTSGASGAAAAPDATGGDTATGTGGSAPTTAQEGTDDAQ